MSPPLVWALRQCLRELSMETLEKSWERHAKVSRHFYERLQRLPLEFLVPNPEYRLATVTTLVLPNGYNYNDVVKYLREKHSIIIFPGLGPTAGKSLRIGIMGVNSTEAVADAVADALVDALQMLIKSSL